MPRCCCVEFVWFVFVTIISGKSVEAAEKTLPRRTKARLSAVAWKKKIVSVTWVSAVGGLSFTEHFPKALAASRAEFLFEEVADGAHEVEARLSAHDEVVAVRIDLLAEEFHVLHVGFADLGEVPEVHVVV